MATDPRTGLYSRQELGSLTGVDDVTLGFWLREGVLRAAEGGGGKGRHRRFRHEEVNLAAILYRLKRFAVSIATMREIAGKFHQAVDVIDDAGMTLEQRTLAAKLVRMLDEEKKKLVRPGDRVATGDPEEAALEFVHAVPRAGDHLYLYDLLATAREKTGEFDQLVLVYKDETGRWYFGGMKDPQGLPDAYVAVDVSRVTASVWGAQHD